MVCFIIKCYKKTVNIVSKLSTKHTPNRLKVTVFIVDEFFIEHITQ